jgi:DNA-binding IscR family transcriptional regulator
MDHTHLTLPTVTKLLKMLAKKDLLTSQRGSQGGYSLAKQANEISVYIKTSQ